MQQEKLNADIMAKANAIFGFVIPKNIENDVCASFSAVAGVGVSSAVVVSRAVQGYRVTIAYTSWFYGREKLTICLGVVRDDDPERDISGIQNIQREVFFTKTKGSNTLF